MHNHRNTSQRKLKKGELNLGGESDNLAAGWVGLIPGGIPGVGMR